MRERTTRGPRGLGGDDEAKGPGGCDDGGRGLAAVAAAPPRRRGRRRLRPRRSRWRLSLEAALERATQQSDEVQAGAVAGGAGRGAGDGDAGAGAPADQRATWATRKTLASAFDTRRRRHRAPGLAALRAGPERAAGGAGALPGGADAARGLGRHSAALFSDLPFGQENAYTASLAGSQLLYSGGRVGAALNIARNYRQAAQLNLAAAVGRDRAAGAQAPTTRRCWRSEMEEISQARRWRRRSASWSRSSSG